MLTETLNCDFDYVFGVFWHLFESRTLGEHLLPLGIAFQGGILRFYALISSLLMDSLAMLG